MQLIQYWHLSSFSKVITNNFIGEDVSLSQYSLECYKSMGCVVCPSTQGKEQTIFTLRTIKPIPVAVYDTPNMWATYGHHILLPNQSLKSNNKVGLHQSFYGSLIEFLCTDSDGNLSFTMNPYCFPKFNKYFLNLFKGLSETKYKVQIFKKNITNGKFKGKFMDHMMDTGILGTVIPLFMFTFFSTKSLKSIQCWNQG
jgi:hypothetical protein